MVFRRLFWRVSLPFVLLVLLALVVLAVTLSRLIDAADRRAFEELAAQNAAFLDHSSLDLTERLADDLRHVTGLQVFCRRFGVLVPAPTADLVSLSLATAPALGVARHEAGVEYVVVAVAAKGELLFVRPAPAAIQGAPVLTVLVISLLLAAGAAWLVVRGLVGPLRNLARQLPDIERAGALTVPETSRGDEIGDLARAFVRTRAALLEAQAARERAEKLAVLGRMTASLAHEVQNPVAAIRLHAQLWRDVDDHPSARVIEHEASRIEGMLNQWLYLSRPEPPAVAPLDVGALLARIVDMHRNQAEHAAVDIVLAADPALLLTADGRRLEQVFRNLLTNALQAMPGGGTLHIRADRAGDGVRIEFADSGVGFSAAALQRCAEFFFSEREGGMGIGLSVVNEIVRAHGGELLVANRADGGAVVTVVLPASPPSGGTS